MANSKILTAEQERELLKPIDEYVGKIQKEIDELRADGTTKLVEYQSLTEKIKRDKTLSKGEKQSELASCQKEIDKAKEVESRNKAQIDELISKAETYLKNTFASKYYNAVKESCAVEKAEALENHKKKMAELERKHKEVLAGLSDSVEIKEENYVYKNKVSNEKLELEKEYQRIIKKESAEEASLAKLFKTICLGSGDEIENAVDVYMQHNFYELNSLEKYHVAVMELISELYHFMANNELDTGQLSGGTRSIYNELSNFEPQVLKKWLINFSTTLHDDMDDVRNHSKKSLIDKAREYVHRNYKHEDLGLDDVCRELGVSNSYFSGMFKKETGKSFVAYITDYRMERAARMLVETGEKSYIIAQNVGYADPNYFSYVFKRKYGVSPSKYRTEYEETQI